MPRISLTEQYDNRDVIAQIYKMKDEVQTGTYKDVSVTDDGAGNLVFVFTDQNDTPTTFTIPVKLISTVASSQSGSTVTMRITWTDGTYTDLSWTAGGDVTTNTAQTITAVKTFTASPLVPTAPAGSTDQTAANTNWISQTGNSSPNNLLHRTGNESSIGEKIYNGGFRGLQGFKVRTSAGTYTKFAEIDGNLSGNGSIIFIVASRGTMGMFRVNVSLDSNTHMSVLGVSDRMLFANDTLKIGIDYDSVNNVYNLIYTPVANNVSINMDVMHATLGAGNNMTVSEVPAVTYTPTAIYYTEVQI